MALDSEALDLARVAGTELDRHSKSRARIDVSTVVRRDLEAIGL
jgi:hypothetical protein